MNATIPYRTRRAERLVEGAQALIAHAIASTRDASLEIGPDRSDCERRLRLSLAVEHLRKATAELQASIPPKAAP